MPDITHIHLRPGESVYITTEVKNDQGEFQSGGKIQVCYWNTPEPLVDVGHFDASEDSVFLNYYFTPKL